MSTTITTQKIVATLENDVISAKIENQVIEASIIAGNITYNIAAPTTQITASENLGGHRVVTVEGYYASKDTANDKFKVLGITTGAVNSGETATVTTYGTITEPSWEWTIGTPIFLSTNGQLTQTAPTSGFRLIIGKPQTATSIFIDISEPLILV